MLRTTLVGVSRTIPAQLRESGGVVSATLNPAYVAGADSVSANYEDMDNKPSINGVELTGDLSFEDLGLEEIQASDIDAIFENIFSDRSGS